MIPIQSSSDLRQWRSLSHTPTVFVPTMGALHPGHAELFTVAKQIAGPEGRVVVSIFVNPAQFGANEDFARYPKTLHEDLRICESKGVNAVFVPQVSEIYPEGFSTWVEETELTASLCGAFRPGHFRGVTTVVLKLFNLVQPTHAVFGWKDAQQFLVLRKMVRDLGLPIEMIGVPTLREADGLALSSRNRFLNAEQRTLAPLLYKKLQEIAQGISEIPAAKKELERNGFRVQYLEKKTLDGVKLIAVAAFLGETRLIDNILLPS